jgi:hypothetical protein
MRDQLFPDPLADETVYSWICRYHQLAAHADFKQVTLKMLGVSDARPANEFPPFLAKLAEISGVSLSKILFELTNIHYFQPFIEEERYLNLLGCLSAGNTTNLQNQLGSIASRITSGEYLKYCPECARDDMEHFGSPYWHRSHQLIGVTACSKHHISLLYIQRPAKTVRLPPLFGDCAGCLEIESKLSHLINDEVTDPDATWFKELSYAAYWKRLKDMNFLTSNGRIRQQYLKSYVIDRLKILQILPKPYPQIVELVLSGSYSESLFYRRSCSHSPLKHYLLIFALFETWAEFKKEVMSGDVHTRQIVRDLSKNNHAEVDWELATTLVSEGYSMRHVAKEFGTTVSSVKLKAINKGIVVNTRPSIVTSNIARAIWRKLVIGAKTEFIAKEIDVSVAAIEKVLTQHTELPELRKRIWYYQALKKHKISIINYLAEHPYATRTEARKILGASYTWLYKHEKNLLYSLLPERVKAIYWPRKP